jgi:hypothetical protein
MDALVTGQAVLEMRRQRRLSTEARDAEARAAAHPGGEDDDLRHVVIAQKYMAAGGVVLQRFRYGDLAEPSSGRHGRSLPSARRARRHRPGGAGRAAAGTLYVARFGADGAGEWRERGHGKNGLDVAAGFPGPAEVCINTRGAADVVGTTKMDRPEWIAVHPATREVYCALTNKRDPARFRHASVTRS